MSSMVHDESQVVVIMVPCWLQGHLNQLLHLSRLVSAQNIPVYYICSATHNRQVRERVHGFDPVTVTNLHFHDLPTPSFQNPSPEANSTDKFPSHLTPAAAASIQMREPVFELIKDISATAKRVVVVYDALIAYVVQDVKTIGNAESYCFQSTSAFTLFSYCWEAAGKPDIPDDARFLNDVPPLEGCFTREFGEYAALQAEANKFQSVKDVVDRHTCLVWLDKQPLDSVMLVSFGSTSTLPSDQVRELALGLERSGHKFIWLLKEADKGDIFAGEARRVQLPEGFEERVRERGVVVRDWAPQLEILGHPSTGGFMSHCGWNSSIESMSMGVPIATWPMHSEQPRNAVLITKVLKIGVEVLDNWDRRDEVLSSAIIESAVKRLMGPAEGNEIRQRAKELANKIKQSVREDGTTTQEISSFITHIMR